MSVITTNMLAGQAAIVTGAAQGIGHAIARALLDHGANVVLADLGLERTQAAADELGAPGRTLAVDCDVMKATDHAAAVQACLDTFGRLDLLVNNAGITRDNYLPKMSEDDFDLVLGVSLKGAWLGTRAVGTLMRERKSGAIVNISSLSGKIGNPGQTNYSAAKAGMVGLTKASARELGPFGVRVNAVQPGLIRSAMTLAMKPEIYAAMETEVPMQRAGLPAEVAGAVVFLASPLASYVNGNVVEVTGGLGI